MTKKKYIGSCHCKKVLFNFISPIEVKLIKCNCTICKPSRYLHLIIPHKNFKLISNKRNIQNYQFGTKKANHFFCKFCVCSTESPTRIACAITSRHRSLTRHQLRSSAPRRALGQPRRSSRADSLCTQIYYKYCTHST